MLAWISSHFWTNEDLQPSELLPDHENGELWVYPRRTILPIHISELLDELSSISIPLIEHSLEFIRNPVWVGDSIYVVIASLGTAFLFLHNYSSFFEPSD